MKIGVFGTGYVGLVTGVCFAEMGNTVTCVDIDLQKIKNLKDGISPIYEPGLEPLLKSNISGKRIHFTDQAKKAIDENEVLFIAVGTPPFEDGSADMKYVLKVAETIAENMQAYKLLVTKSTVPIGTALKIQTLVQSILTKRGVALTFDVASNPEFLREGSAIDDCMKTNRVVVGVSSEKAENLLRRLYEPFLKGGQPFLVMDPPSSEMTKYAANAMLATKISLMNEISRLCEKTGANIENIRIGVGADHRIGPYSIYAGVGYGGSCFPKDVRALIKMGEDAGEDLEILKSVKKANDIQRERFINKIVSFSKPDKSKTYAVWGVSFKPKTDDIREAPALDIIDELLKAGCTVNCYDPVAEKNTIEYFKNNPRVKFYSDQYETLNQCAALVIPTEWKSFRNPDFQAMKEKMVGRQIFDGRNIYNKDDLQTYGFEYFSIGRP